MEALRQREQASCRSIARDRVCIRITNEADLVLYSELIAVLAEFLEAVGGVVGAVEASEVLVKEVETILDITNCVLLLRHSSSLVNLRGRRRIARVKTQRNPPRCFILLGFDITSKQEALLAQANLTRFFSNGDDWEADSPNPEVHEGVYILTRRLAQGRPQVIGCGIRVLVSLEVVGYTLEENLLTEMSAQHADDRGALEVGDVVKDLVDLETVVYGYFDGMRGSECVECEGLLYGISLEDVVSGLLEQIPRDL